jgi:galactokinase
MLNFLDRKNEAEMKRAEKVLGTLYGVERINENIERYRHTVADFRKLFTGGEIDLFSSPGRTEILGNHTDHNGGLVLSASIDLDSICAAAKTSEQRIRVFSEGFSAPFQVDIDDLDKRDSEEGTTEALIRGIAAGFKERGYAVGGFNGFITSKVPIGSGLSSSASIEVLLATILSIFYNNGSIEPLEIARIGQYAENCYFNKPCGLMDQISCAVGGVVMIDFKDFARPVIKRIQFDFCDLEYVMLVVDTGPGHADLTDDYASVTEEMGSVAKLLGRAIMREVPFDDFRGNIMRLRSKLSDRAVLRAYHFLSENERVLAGKEALEKSDIDAFLDLVQRSGDSSAKWLQNSFSVNDSRTQGITVACALSEDFFKRRRRGAFRVHGGGFAGTIQVFIHRKDVKQYIQVMEEVFGKDSVTVLKIRPRGTVWVNSILESDSHS